MDTRLVTISYKDGLADGWVKKLDVACNELMGKNDADETHVNFWIEHATELGEKWFCATWWRDYQFSDISLAGLEAVMDKHIPRPFRDDITCTEGVPQDRWLYPVTNGVTPP